MEVDSQAKKKTNKKVFTGEVVSDKMQKTIVVKITTRKLHDLYKKYIVRSKKFKAHDENGEAHIGDTVRIIECRPISKDKCFKLMEIVVKAK